MDFIIEKKKTPVIRKVDVIVIGGGPAGFGAALAATRNGAETLLIERYGFLGGLLTGGLVIFLPLDKLLTIDSFGETRPLQGGIVTELTERLVEVGGSYNPAVSYQTVVGDLEAFYQTDPEICKIVLQNMLEEAKTEIILHSFAVDVVKKGKEVKGIIIESKSGRQAILANIIIDASGDADMAAAAGAEYEKFESPLLMTLEGVLANVDIDKAIRWSRLEGLEEFNALVEEAVKNGDLSIAEKSVLPESEIRRISVPMVLDPNRYPSNWYRRGEAIAWMEHASGDATNVHDLTKAELKTRKALLQIVNFFRKYVSGYEHAYLAYTGTQIGVRESRRVLGDYILTAQEDMRKGLKHKDVIVKGRLSNLRDLSLCTPELSPVFDIPYRCIVPKVVDGLLTAGRCISLDHEAASLASPRDISTSMCLGQAAGTAAALSVKAKVRPRDLDISLLQTTLKKQGANLD